MAKKKKKDQSNAYRVDDGTATETDKIAPETKEDTVEEQVQPFPYKLWLKQRRINRTFRNFSEQYLVDYIVWSYSTGDGTLHESELSSVLQELCASDQLKWVQKELFGGGTNEQVLDSSPSIPPPLVPPAEVPLADGDSSNTIAVMSVPPLPPPQPSSQPTPLPPTSTQWVSTSKTVTRKQFQQFWFSKKRKNYLALNHARYCPSVKCISALQRRTARRMAHSTHGASFRRLS